MKLNSLRDLFVAELKDLYSAEKQLLKALPRMAKAAQSPKLRKAFEEHLTQTRGQVERLETIFGNLDVNSRNKKCVAMEGLIEEGKEVIDAEGADDVRDAALIAAAQRVEHYEIAGYGLARTFAGLLGEDKALRLLEKSLQEEKDTDERLTVLAESVVNREALVGGD